MKAQFHLPLITYPDASSDWIIENALELSRHQGAALSASVLQVRIPRISHPFPTIVDVEKMVHDAEQLSRQRATALTEKLRTQANTAQQDVTVVPFEAKQPFVGERVAQLSRAYDFSILELVPTARSLIESVLFDGGRPAVIFPAASCSGRIETIAIAWDGSATAARAVTGARYFLEKCSSVVLVSVTDDKLIDKDIRDRLAETLSRSGLRVEVVTLHLNGDSAAAAIQSAATEKHADLLVAGAFGHSRLREFILGGVTRSFLTDLSMPILMSH